VGWTTLVEFLSKLGYSDDHIEAAGMATRARSGHLVDRFRDRLTIPVLDQTGDLVAFVGRLAPGRDEDHHSPRYLNSPATPLYAKGDVLYGLGMHRGRIASGYLPVLCEGPLDAIAVDLAAQAAGARMVGVAASGTAFTDRHAAQLTAQVGDRPICLAFDGDLAGRSATEAAWRRLTDSGPRPVTAAAIPDGSDPAHLMATGHAGALPTKVAEARTAADVVVDHTLAGVDLAGNSPRQLAAFRQLLPCADRIPNDQRVPFIIALAGRLDIDIDVAAAEVANRDPAMLTDRIIDHCKEAEARLKSTTTAAGLQPAAHNAQDAPQLRLT
jgi:DNA primase catalytic core